MNTILLIDNIYFVGTLPNENNFSVEALEAAANELGTQVVYALDDDGNQVAVGLLVDAGFVKDENASSYSDEQNVHEGGQLVWLGGQEDITTQNDEYCEVDVMKIKEEDLSVQNGKIEGAREKEGVEIYNVKRGKKKTLQELKRQLQEKNLQNDKNFKKKLRMKAGLHTEATKKRKIRKRSNDYTFWKPSSVALMTLPCKYRVHSYKIFTS